MDRATPSRGEGPASRRRFYAAYCYRRAAVGRFVHPRGLLLLWSNNRVANVRLCLAFLVFLTISVIPIISTFPARIIMQFSTFGSAMAVDERSEPRFSDLQGMSAKWGCYP